jgi:UDP-N-acetylglucosamine--N-acetylmuramyl-(pentapeptide) pyrophosphoryl-undecaprenol N-acetylglucosamine transferase
LKKILLTGGGTAGHVTPNLALIPQLHELGYDIHYIGTKNGIEKELVAREKITFHSVSAGKLRRYFDFKNFTDLFKIAAGFIQSFAIVARLQPHIVFSKGGFVSCPVVWASWLLGKPVIIHESDITPGLANKLSIPFAKKICYSFPETGKHLRGRKGVHTGLPVRKKLFIGSAEEGKKLCGFADNKPVIMVICGSLGSQVINSAIRESLDILLLQFNVCHICGKGSKTESKPGYSQFEYVNDELPHLFAMADLIVSRSGATTLFEILSLRKANLLIPLAANASRGDQILNARSFEKQGFSKILLQENLNSTTLIDTIKETFNNRESLICAMEKSSLSDGVAAIIEVIQTTVPK